jgi:molecular chaperone GrpE
VRYNDTRRARVTPGPSPWQSANVSERIVIPIRVVKSGEPPAATWRAEGEPLWARDGLGDDDPNGTAGQVQGPANAVTSDDAIVPTASPHGVVDDEGGQEGKRVMQGHDCDGWRDQALRLRAEMDNFRKRQQRLAQDQIDADRNRLLAAFLDVIDDLERALEAPVGDSASLRRGVELTHQAAMHLLQQEGIEQIQAAHRPFDPNWHEAVATVNANDRHPAPPTVVRVIAPGYRLGDRLLRPAKVVVALSS